MNRALVASLGAALLIGSTAASGAAPLSPAMAAGAQAGAVDGVTNVQWRGRHGWHGHHWHGGWRGRHWRHGGYGWGPAIGGLAAGAIIGGAIASSNAAAGNTVSYCMSRFKSYDPASGTYLGYDGLRHPCP